MKIWAFLLLVFGLSASVNEPLRLELSTGYRNDRFHWHLQNPGDGSEITYAELDRDIQFWENAFVLKSIYRDLTFFLRGSYGVLGRGNVFQKYADLSFTTDQPHFQFITHGWCAEASGYFGYAVNLTDNRTYKVILIPILGYGGYFEKLDRKEGRPNPFFSLNAVGANEYTMASQARPLHMSWNGYFIGAGFIIEPGNPLVLQAGYSYHFIRARLHTKILSEVTLGSPPISETASSFSVKATQGGNLAHTGWLQLDYKLDCNWRAGVGGLIHYFSTSVFRTTLHTSTGKKDQMFKLRWCPVSGWIQFSRDL